MNDLVYWPRRTRGGRPVNPKVGEEGRKVLLHLPKPLAEDLIALVQKDLEEGREGWTAGSLTGVIRRLLVNALQDEKEGQ